MYVWIILSVTNWLLYQREVEEELKFVSSAHLVQVRSVHIHIYSHKYSYKPM